MVEFLTRAPVLDAAHLAQGADARATLKCARDAAQFIFRGSDAAARAASQSFGVDLPLIPCRAAQHGSLAALWLGPDEWLLIAPADQATTVEAALKAGLGYVPYSLVGVSHRNAALTIEGPALADVLSAGCPLDLHEAAFPTGTCTRTVLDKAAITLWRTAPEQFYVNTWRSFMPYVWDYLVEARTRL